MKKVRFGLRMCGSCKKLHTKTARCPILGFRFCSPECHEAIHREHWGSVMQP